MPLFIDFKENTIKLFDEDDFDHFLFVDNLTPARAAEVTARYSNVVGFIHALANVATEAGIVTDWKAKPTMIRQRPLRFLPYPRYAALQDLVQAAGADLYASDTFKTGTLPRKVNGSEGLGIRPEDRYVAQNVYKSGLKNNSDVLASPFVMIEVDDEALITAVDESLEWAPDADLTPTILAFAGRQIRDAQRALSLFLPPEVEVPPPFYACYSGMRSIHFLWRLDKPLTPEQRAACFAMKDRFVSAVKEKKAKQIAIEGDLAAFSRIDPGPLFSGVAMFRVPCNAAEWSEKYSRWRNPQVAWHCTDHATEPNFDTLPASAFVARAKQHCEEIQARLMLVNRYAFTPRSERQKREGFRNVTREEVEGALGKR